MRCRGRIARFCAYNAIACIGSKTLVYPERCNGCVGCVKVRPGKAIRETARRIGTAETRHAGRITLIQGRLEVGAAMFSPVVRAVKGQLRYESPAILDAPPGTFCSVVAIMRGADFVRLVTEPTPFGLYDANRASRFFWRSRKIEALPRRIPGVGGSSIRCRDTATGLQGFTNG